MEDFSCSTSVALTLSPSDERSKVVSDVATLVVPEVTNMHMYMCVCMYSVHVERKYMRQQSKEGGRERKLETRE